MTIRLTLLLATAVAALGACSDANGPENFSPMSTSQKVEQAFGAVDNNKAVQSLSVLSRAFTLTATAPLQLGPPVGPAVPLPAAARSALSEPAALFPQNAAGKTFTYNGQTGKYQAGDITGAPALGVRYLLYAVDPVSATVVTPLQQVGLLDLADKSSSAANTLGVTASIGNATVLDYDANAAVAASTFTFGAKGYVLDGGSRLDFDLAQNVAANNEIKIDYKITAPNQGNMSIRLEANGTYGGSSTATLTITEGKDKMEILVTGTSAGSTGSVKYNGKGLANISVTGNNDPVFTGTGGRVLTAEDGAGLKQLFNLVDALLERFDDLLVPAYFVFGLQR